MAKIPGPLLLLGGVAAVALLGQKKKADAEKAEEESNLDPAAVPPVKEDGVGFSANFENYKIGSSWRIKILDPYLDKARKDGILVVDDWKSVDKAPWMADLIKEYGLPETWGAPANAALAAGKVESRVHVLNAFARDHFVSIPGGSTTIEALPDTGGVKNFLDTVSDYADAFQKRTFS